MLESTHEVVSALESRSANVVGMGLKSQLSDVPLNGKMLSAANQGNWIERIASAADQLITDCGVSHSDAQKMLCDLLSRNFYGQYCEFLAYEWFLRNGVKFLGQQSAAAVNRNSPVLDGLFQGTDVYFDVKAFGFEAYVRERFRAAIQEKFPAGRVSLEGPVDVSVKDIEQNAFRQVTRIQSELTTAGISRVEEFGWTLRLTPATGVSISTTEFNPYKIAEANRFYPFKSAGQFSVNSPFLLVFAYSALINPWIATNFLSSSETIFRALSRRAFIELSADTGFAKGYDDKVPELISLGTVSGLLSGMLFLNVDKDEEAWLYVNPRAVNPLSELTIRQIFDFRDTVWIDDFRYDNY